MNNTIIGTCSECGSAVSVPTFWWGTIPPVPQCVGCGAVAAQPYGPVIPMKQNNNYKWNWKPSTVVNGTLNCIY